MIASILTKLEIPALITAPIALFLCAYLQIEQGALLTLLAACFTLVIFFAGFESRKPALRQIMPTVVLGALAAAGRILFAPIPDFKPVSAICILAGAVFGKRCGFMVGALAALCSNFFFGQGPWTPWQMYSWGMIGYFAGILSEKGFFDLSLGKKTTLGTAMLLSYGFLSGLGYGFILNTWYIVGFVTPITWQGALSAYLAGLPLDLIHGSATVVFLLALYLPWKRKLTRIKNKYELTL